MASAVRRSTEQADLDSLIHITQHLSDLLDIPESQPRLLWPPKLASTALPKLASLATQFTMPKLSNVNGSKLHTYSVKAAPYPLSYNQAVLDSDICDRITLKKLCKNGLTLHEFHDGPPDSVLDIGTGSGSWVLEAASQWKTTRFIGLDLVEIQPTLSLNGTFEASYNRIQWVQGNALDGLPFSTETFSLVRMCKIAMGVPENKWHHLLEEAIRVLKPGGILEIIEEDTVFPYRALPEDSSHNSDTMSRSTAASVSVHGDHDSSGSSGDHSIRTFPAASTRRPLSIVVPKTLNPRTRSRSLGASSNNVPQNIPSIKSTSSQLSASTSFSSHSSEWMSILPALTTSEAEALGIPVRDPRNHSVLYHAWNAMLDQRFIALKPTSLLTCYLPIHLGTVKSHEPIQIVAPLPSYLPQSRQSSPSSPGEDSYDVHLSTIDAAPSGNSRGSGIFTTKDAPMHLRRVLQVVLGCAEALWTQVSSKYPDMPRDCFDVLLRDFELDMLDRIDTRSALKSWFGWDSHMGTSDLRKWRERVASVTTLPHPEEGPLICRSIRGFVGVKGSS